MQVAKLFWSDGLQSVRLPEGFHFDADEVRLSRRGSAVILEPVARDWAWLDALCGALDIDFERIANERGLPQERPGLDTLFD